MTNAEISGIFHDFLFLTAYVAGVISAILTGKKNNIHPSVSLMVILICTMSYLFFNELFIGEAEGWYLLLKPGLHHIDRIVGLAGLAAGLFMSGLLLSIPLSIVYRFFFPILLIFGLSNLGCLFGHCQEIHNGTVSYKAIYSMASWSLYHKSWFAENISALLVLRAFGGILAAGILFYFRKRIKNPRNLALLVLSAILWTGFFNLFATPDNALFYRMFGLNIFQWAILLSNMLLIMSVASNELTVRKRYPKRKFNPPANYALMILYLFIVLLAFPESFYLSETHLQIFIIGFSLNTVFLIYYFHSRIQPSLIRYATIVVLLGVGSIFLQASIFSPDGEDMITPLKRIKTEGSLFENTTEHKGSLPPGKIRMFPSRKRAYPFINSYDHPIPDVSVKSRRGSLYDLLGIYEVSI